MRFARSLLRLSRTAGFRLAALYVGLFAASALLLGGTVFFAARAALQHQMRQRIGVEAAYLGDEFHAGGLDRLVAAIQSRGRGASALDYLVQKNGAHLAGEMPAIPGLVPGWATLDVPEAEEDAERPESVRALVTDLDRGLLLVVGDDVGRISEVEEAIVTAFSWTIGMAALLGIGGGLLLSRGFLARVDAISTTAEAIIAGDLARRVPLRGTGDDLDRLAATLNRMLDRITALMDSLRQVGSDVAHDLRTPLTRLFQRLEEAKTRALTLDDHQAALDAATLEAERLLDTFSALLRIAQVEGAPRDRFAPVDLAVLVETVTDAYRPDAELAGQTLDASVTPCAPVLGDADLLTQALANLVENALRHTPARTRIRVSLRQDPHGRRRLSVDDDGPGVDDVDRPHLTRRFYRGERSRTTPGNGLGLSLVVAVADLHDAGLTLVDARPGLRVSLSFPPVSLVRTP